MRFSALAALPLAALVVSAHKGMPSRRNHSKRFHTRKAGYAIQDFFQGEDFFSGFSFFTGDDPTNGNVDYVDLGTAQSDNLAYVQSDNTTVLAVDNTSKLSVGQNRKSVRISSKATYSSGLIIADIAAMPHGCSVWPAFWMVGSDWPNHGEIDIIEGVNLGTQNQMTLHTGADCTLDKSVSTSSKVAAFTASVLGTQCTSSAGNNAGCAFLDASDSSYGHGFNTAGGGVFATLIQDSGISIWRFGRDEVPSDISSQNPDPTSWGSPQAFWSSSTCDIGSHFIDMSIVFDTTLCGDWAGATFSQSCSGSCSSAVADPTNFDTATWKINYVAVFQ